MSQLGQAYRETAKLAEDDAAALEAQVEAVFKGMVAKLPPRLRKAFKGLPEASLRPGEDFTFNLDEAVPKFSNPAQ